MDEAATQRQAKVATAVFQWRWLTIDEIRMVSPALLAEVDCKLRNIVFQVCFLFAWMWATLFAQITWFLLQNSQRCPPCASDLLLPL